MRDFLGNCGKNTRWPGKVRLMKYANLQMVERFLFKENIITFARLQQDDIWAEINERYMCSKTVSRDTRITNIK